ncbi:MAG: hypothetical protein AB7S71_01570 [Dongiaceae bacterium]
MIGKWMAWTAALTLLGACAPWAGESTDTLLLVHGSAEVAGTSPAWCYYTLGEPDCFTYPDPAATDRLIGAYVPVRPYPDTEPE